MKLYVLENGNMVCDKRYQIAGFNYGTASNRNPLTQFVDIPIHAFLIDHPEGLVLFDTGCNPKGMTERWPEYIKDISPYEVNEESLLVNRLAQLNFKPEDIKYVVMSHLHADHEGNLELFTNSEIFVNDEDFTRTIKQYVLNEDVNFLPIGDIEQWIRARNLHWRLVEAEEKELKLMEGVTILNFGSGHSWGCMGLFLELQKTGNIILVADAIYTSENLGPPIKMQGVVYDSLGYISTLKRIKKMADERNSRIWFGHDKKQYDGLIKSTEGYYE